MNSETFELIKAINTLFFEFVTVPYLTTMTLDKFKINKCVNCGLCSYVCPSKIEVRELIKKMKEELK